jgi:hypothetical protein
MSKHKAREEFLAQFRGSHHPVTGAQTRGPVWHGPLPRAHADSRIVKPVPRAIREHNAKLEKPALGIDPSGGLARLLASPGVDRPLRRLILAVVQGKPGPKRDRRARQAGRLLAPLGISLG